MSYISDLKKYNKHELETFEINQLRSCQAAILTKEDNNILLSYNSLICVNYKGYLFISDYYKNYSVTTSRHISWFKYEIFTIETFIVDHDIIIKLYNNIKDGVPCNLLFDTIINNIDINNKILDAAAAANDDISLLLPGNNITTNETKNRFINNLSYYDIDYNKLYEPVAYYTKELKTRFKKIEAFKLNNIYLEIITTYSNNNKLLKEDIKIKKVEPTSI